MIKNTARLDQLFAQHISQSLTGLEKEEFWSYVNDPLYEQDVMKLISGIYSDPENVSMISPSERAMVLSRIFKHAGETAPSTFPAAAPVKLWRKIAVAAAVAVVVFGAGLFYYSQQNNAKDQQLAAAHTNDVAPGKQGATLTLANGKKIRLTEAINGALATESGVAITKTKDGQLVYEIKEAKTQSNKINTLSTAKGETYQVKLPDGTMVWLNAASSLTYSASLIERGKRTVKLTGEGYFQVAKDKVHPFIVQTEKQEVEVLGTHFNINSYTDESVQTTTLIEGSVKVKSHGKSQTIIPGEQTLNDGLSIKVAKANIENVMDWKDGDFNLDELDFQLAMRKIARWYDVEVIYKQNAPLDFQTVGWISRDKKLSVVLKSIESLGFVHFKIEEKKIYVTK